MAQKPYNAEEVSGFDDRRLKELESETRSKLALMRMELYKGQNSSSADKRGLRKTLARVLTAKSMRRIESKGASK